MGPYDLNINLSLKLQLPDSKLNFKEYTEFHHEGNTCFELKLKFYNKYADLQKIDAYRIFKKIETKDDSTEGTDEEEDDRKVYTCQSSLPLPTVSFGPVPVFQT